MLTARSVEVQLPAANDKTSHMLQLLHYMESFKHLEKIFVSNIAPTDACVHFFRYRFGRVLSKFEYVHVTPYTPMASFAIVDPTSTYAISANRSYCPQVDQLAMQEKNHLRPRTHTDITLAEAKFLKEFKSAYKSGDKFKVMGSSIGFEAKDVREHYEDDE